MKTRVFISCGQNPFLEGDLPSRIAKLLESLGYDPYVAVMEQSLRGLKENIFARLADSEYFLFIDFKRPSRRGKLGRSLFSHQELAIASFLDKDVIAFREKGTKPEGLMSFLQGNAIEFADRDALLSMLAAKVSSSWNSGWRAEMTLDRDPMQFGNEYHEDRGSVKYYHICATNLHRSKNAIECFAYLERLVDLEKGIELPIPVIEHKWRGVQFPSVMIPFGKSREVDAFLVYDDTPDVLFLCSFTDSARHAGKIIRPGAYGLVFGLHAQNFPYVRREFRLEFKGVHPGNIVFQPSGLISM